MKIIQLDSTELIVFVMVDATGTEVPDLGTDFAVQISKNGAAFAAGVGTKDEVGLGYYSYELTAAETDTLGSLAVVITADGCVQQNLVYEVSGSVWEAPSGPNVLSAVEAALFLRCDVDDQVMLQLLPLVDEYLLSATGHDWAADATIHPAAKSAAGMALITWYDNPGLVGMAPTAMLGLVMQLEAEALKYVKYHITGLTGAGGISLPGARKGSEVLSVTGVYGVSGDQSASFESVLSEEEQVQQTSAADLSENQYVVVVKHPAEDVNA